jgi:hypothetical protein
MSKAVFTLNFEKESDTADTCKFIYDNYIANSDHELTVLKISRCDETGTYDNMKIHIYPSYLKAAGNIKYYEYKFGDAVDVYIVDKDTYIHVKEKLFDAAAYSCLAGCEPIAYRDSSDGISAMDSFIKTAHDLANASIRIM